MSGLLLGPDPAVRSWISFYVRNGQKRLRTMISSGVQSSADSLCAYRRCLLEQVRHLVAEAPKLQQQTSTTNSRLWDEQVIKASAVLRLYTALRGIAGMK